jgi:hypothetical protein
MIDNKDKNFTALAPAREGFKVSSPKDIFFFLVPALMLILAPVVVDLVLSSNTDKENPLIPMINIIGSIGPFLGVLALALALFTLIVRGTISFDNKNQKG